MLFSFVTPAHLVFALCFVSSHGDKLSSDDAVKRVLAGEKGDVKGRTSLATKPQEPDNRNARDEGPRAPREREVGRKLHLLESQAARLS